MQRFRRAMAMWSLSLLLQPSLLGGVVGCGSTPVGEGGTVDGRASHVMASMAPMAGNESMAMDMGVPEPSNPSTAPAERCDTDGSGGSCNGPHMPSGCAAMSACASPPMVTVALAPMASNPALHARTPEPLALPSGIAESPESPPPRA